MSRRRANAFDVGLEALGRRDLTAVELFERITRAGIGEEEAARAVDELRDAGYQSDGRAARERARVLAGRGVGDAGISADLRRKGLAPESFQAILADLPPEIERAKRLAARLGPGRRLALALERKGYSAEAIHAAAGFDVADAP